MTMPLRFRRQTLLLWSAPLLIAALSGCSLFEVPERISLPTAPTMPPLKPVFTAADGSTKGTLLNVPGDPLRPDALRAVRVDIEPVDPGNISAGGAPIIYLQKVRYKTPGTGAASGSNAPPGGAVAGTSSAAITPGGNVAPGPAPDAVRAGKGRTPAPTPKMAAGSGALPIATPAPGVLLGDTQAVRLAGIVLPLNEPYRTAALNTLNNWLVNIDPANIDPKKNDLDADQDKVYPFDLQGRARVQIFFKGRGGNTKDQSLNLARLMVRSGYAVVDLYSPTTFDVTVWLIDEQVARGEVTGSQPVGLWRNPTFALENRKSPTPTPAPVLTGTPKAGSGAGRPASPTPQGSTGRNPVSMPAGNTTTTSTKTTTVKTTVVGGNTTTRP